MQVGYCHSIAYLWRLALCMEAATKLSALREGPLRLQTTQLTWQVILIWQRSLPRWFCRGGTRCSPLGYLLVRLQQLRGHPCGTRPTYKQGTQGCGRVRACCNARLGTSAGWMSTFTGCRIILRNQVKPLQWKAVDPHGSPKQPHPDLAPGVARPPALNTWVSCCAPIQAW